MKKVGLLVAALLILSCKTKHKETSESATAIPMDLLDSIAYAHGFAHWAKVEELQFSFNVDRDSSHFERHWIWDIDDNRVTAIQGQDTIRYSRNASLDSLAQQANRGFINDKFWLLAPFNLVWDKGNFTYEHFPKAMAPISGKPMQQLTIVYGNEGGYTPGDAYDLYLDDALILREWVFRKGNQPEPSMSTTWEDYTDIEGLHIAQAHKNQEGNFKLYFTGLAVE